MASGNITIAPTVGSATAKAVPTSADASLTGAFLPTEVSLVGLPGLKMTNNW